MKTIADKGLFDYFLKSDQGQELVKKRQGEIRESRLQAISKIETTRADQEKQMPKFNQAASDAWSKVLKARKSLEKAEANWAESQREKRAIAHGFETTIHQAETFLRNSADPAIDLFIRELRDLQEQIMARDVTNIELPGKRNPVSLAREKDFHGNVEVVRKALAAIREGIRSAENLKSQDIEDLDAALNTIRQTIPKVEGIASPTTHMDG